MEVSNQLRAAIRGSGKSANVLAKQCGIPQPTITRFLAGGEMRSNTIDKLAAYFGLELGPGKAKARAKRKGK